MPYTYRQPGNWKTTRRRILMRDAHRCYRCGGLATQVDHVVPVAQGGTHDDHNLGAICPPCHDAKTRTEQRAGRRQSSASRPPEQHPNRVKGPGAMPPTPPPRLPSWYSPPDAASDSRGRALGLEVTP